MNKKDLTIISHLRQNARIPLTKLSRKINVPVSTIFDRVKISEGGLIVKYTSLLDFAKLGYNIRANIAFKVPFTYKRYLKDYLIAHRNVNSVYAASGTHDFVIDGLFKTMKELEAFTSEVDRRFEITDRNIVFLVEEIKRESFLSEPDLVEMIMD